MKLKAFSPKTCLGNFTFKYVTPSSLSLSLPLHSESLVIVPISQSSALQRSGRAGRLRSGKAYRLYTGIVVYCIVSLSHLPSLALSSLLEESYKSLDRTTVAEMQRSSMAPVVLQLKALGVDNVLRFDYLSVC